VFEIKKIKQTKNVGWKLLFPKIVAWVLQMASARELSWLMSPGLSLQDPHVLVCEC
jgi:hypothetical protein